MFWRCCGSSPRPACQAGRCAVTRRTFPSPAEDERPALAMTGNRTDWGSPAEWPWLYKTVGNKSRLLGCTSCQPCSCRGGGQGWYARSKLLRLYLGEGWKDIANHREARHSSTRLVPRRQLSFNTAKARRYRSASALSDNTGLDPDSSFSLLSARDVVVEQCQDGADLFWAFL